MKRFAPIPRESLSGRIKRVLLQRILDGTYAPGHRLVEMEIARELRTSQGPVREALRELEAIEVIRTQPYKGARVREVSEREMREAYDVRALLEQYAAELAAPRLKGNAGELRSEADAIRAAAEAGDRRAYARHDVPFHRKIVAAAGNGALLRAWDSLGFEARVPRLLARCDVDLLAAQKLHRPIVEALARGEGKRAGRLLRQHLNSFYAAAKPPAPAALTTDGSAHRAARAPRRSQTVRRGAAR